MLAAREPTIHHCHIYIALLNLICWTLVPYLLRSRTTKILLTQQRMKRWRLMIKPRLRKIKILYCVRQVCTGGEIRTKQTAECPLVLKWILSGGEEGFLDEAFSDEDIGKPTPLPRTKAQGREKLVERGYQPHCSHHWAALGLLFLEGGREQLGAAGQVEEAFGQAAVGARLGHRLKLVDAGQSRSAENAMDALLWREGGAFQVRLGPELLGHGWTLGQRWGETKRSVCIFNRRAWVLSKISQGGCRSAFKPSTNPL